MSALARKRHGTVSGTSWRAPVTVIVAALWFAGAPAVPAAGELAPTSAPLVAAAGGGCPARVLAGMSLAQRVGQLFMVGVDAPPTTAQLRLIARDHAGGVLFAHVSHEGVVGTRARAAQVQQVATTAGVRLWVAADQEGGFVQHLQGNGFSDIPTALVQGRWAPATLRERARTWGLQLRAAGVNLNLAPVADTVPRTLGAGNRPIGYYYREYAHRPSEVSSHALAVRRGMKDAHVQTVAKHFPGLGRVRADTDTTSGVTDAVTSRYGRWAVQPFRDLIADHVPVVMVSSVRYTKIDAARIGPLSATLMRAMLRGDLGFTGTVMSDSLTAVALSAVPSRLRALRFLQAGGDVALVGKSTAADAMYRTVLRHAQQYRQHHLIDTATLAVLRTKNRQGLLSCSPPSTPGPAGTQAR